MNVSPQDLQTLHRLLRQKTDLTGRLKRGPIQIKAGEGNLAAKNQALESAKETAQRTRMAADEKQLQLKSHEAKITDLEGKRNTCNTNKEFQTLVEQIAAAEMANSVLADEILESLEKYDELEVAVGAAKDEVQKAEADLAKLKKKVEAEKEKLLAEVARIDGEIAEYENKLPSEFRTEYDRLVKAKGEDALAKLEGESCGCCYQMMTPQNLDQLRLGNSFFCRGCGALVYKPEDTSVANSG